MVEHTSSASAPASGAASPRPLRIGIGGIGIESSTFTPHRSGLADFRVLEDQQWAERYPWVGRSAGWDAEVSWIPTFSARALPGGPVDGQAYLALKRQLLSHVERAGMLDGFLVDIHGAMNVAGIDDAEADLVAALRAAVGPGALLSAAMDLHGNVSARLAELLDLLTCYRTAPHIDELETRERAARLLAERLRHGGRPSKAWVSIPVLLPGEKTSTRIEPAAALYERIAAVADRDGILDAAMWVGYAWADEPRSGAAVVVTGDDRELVERSAAELASAYWEARERFEFVAPAADLATCIATALASDARPYFISDSGDNPTAGGAGDASFALRALLELPQLAAGELSVIHASITDPDAVAACIEAGVGAELELELGGKIDARPGGPLPMRAIVEAAVPGVGSFCDMAVVSCGGLECIITTRRAAFHQIADFNRLGIDPLSADIVVVKIGYLEPELHRAAADWMLALTPGGVDQDLTALPYRRLRRPIFPLDTDFEPNLEPRLL